MKKTPQKYQLRDSVQHTPENCQGHQNKESLRNQHSQEEPKET